MGGRGLSRCPRAPQDPQEPPQDPTMLTKAAMKTRRRLKTAMPVLRARDWTMPRDSCCRALGKSWGDTEEPVRNGRAPPKKPPLSQPPGTHSDAGVDGADEEDGGEEDEDADVDPEHQRGAGERREVSEGAWGVGVDILGGGCGTHWGNTRIWRQQMKQKTRRVQAT